MSDRPKRNLLSVYGIFPAFAAAIPAIACVLLAIYLVNSRRFDLVQGIVDAYPVLSACKTGTFIVISSMLYVYRYISVVIILAAILSIVISAIRNISSIGFVAITSTIFSAPFLSMHFANLIILSRESIGNICAYRNLPVDGIMHFFLIVVASYIIWGNFVISIRRENNGGAND